jgi:hypothetical protein
MLTEDTQVHAVWFVGCEGRDWMAMVLKQPGEDWMLRYRFRHGASPEPFDDRDELRWYDVCPKEGEVPPDMLAEKAKMVAMLASLQMGGTPVDEIKVNGNGNKALDLIRARPWCHFRIEGAPSPNTPPARD